VAKKEIKSAEKGEEANRRHQGRAHQHPGNDEEEGVSAESAKQAAKAAALEKKAADSAAKKEIKSAETKEKKRVANEDKAKEKERAKKRKG
jgi:hypothetical protein